MKTRLVIFTASLLLVAGLAWAQMGGFGGGGGGMGPMDMMGAMMGGGMGPMGGFDGFGAWGSPGFGAWGSPGFGAWGSPGLGAWGTPGWGAWGPTPGAATTPDASVIGQLLQQQQNYRLSADQVRQLQAILNEAQIAALRARAAIPIAEQGLNALLRTVPVDLANVEAKIKEIEELRSQERLAQANALAKASGVLTPEQNALLGQILAGGALIPGAIGPSAGVTPFDPRWSWPINPGVQGWRGGFGGRRGCM